MYEYYIRFQDFNIIGAPSQFGDVVDADTEDEAENLLLERYPTAWDLTITKQAE